MKKRILLILLVLSVSASVTGFTPVKNESKGWKAIFKEVTKAAETEEQIPYSYFNHPVVLERADGRALYTGNYFDLEMSAADAKAFPELAKWISSYNKETAESLKKTMRGTASDVYDFADGGWEVTFDISGSFIPVRSDSKVFSFVEGAYTYMGGAHGFQSYKSHNIDPKTGEAIGFYDVFADTEELPEILFKEVLTQNEDLVDWFNDLLEDEEAWQNSFERKNFVQMVERGLDSSPVLLSWALDYDGVRFYFEDYSLGSYAAGARNCKIKFEEYPQLFTDEYSTSYEHDIAEIALEGGELDPEILHAYEYDALYAYTEFLQGYMENPIISEDSELGEDTAEDISDVAVNLIYLDDDEIPELVIANGDRPENPVHLLSYDPDLKEIVLIGSFSLYGKMYYEPEKGNLIPMYYMPLGDGIVYRYENGEYEQVSSWLMDYSGEKDQFFVDDKKASRAEVEKTYEAWLKHPFRPVFSEVKAIHLDDEDLQGSLKRAAGLDYTKSTLDGVWKAEDGEFTYLETDKDNFAVYDENGFVEYMGMLDNIDESGSLHCTVSFETYTPDGGFFSFGEWLQADDPLEDVIELKGQTFKRYDTSSTGTPVRSVSQFLNPDITFLGEHEGIGFDGFLKIEEANVQTGGYAITVDFGDGITGEGYANLTTNGTLYINQAGTDKGEYFTGEITYEESLKEFELKINDSPNEKLPEGATLSFTY